MTDKEIIKALECCSDVCNTLCPLHKNLDCRNRLCLNALALINRQKAEIERLKAEADQIAEDYSNLVIEKDELFDEAEKLIKKTKAEAAKEFAERIEQSDVSESDKYIMVRKHKFDKILKEKVGDEK